MKIARITGTVTATIKDSQLAGVVLLVADIEDADGTIVEKSVVAADSCSAGPGDLVLLASGSAARLPVTLAGRPVDLAVVAVLETLTIPTNRSSARRVAKPVAEKKVSKKKTSTRRIK
ncbi:hypothetical protein AB833_29385 [Chromatiales bacterium (ex Bugula neritina AB1)]|nr:hypothetical protein AB833_29385 [Chromatiales bacterium (ex Bugula neritina AB1)]